VLFCLWTLFDKTLYSSTQTKITVNSDRPVKLDANPFFPDPAHQPFALCQGQKIAKSDFWRPTVTRQSLVIVLGARRGRAGKLLDAAKELQCLH
jgi:hypothetical protein